MQILSNKNGEENIIARTLKKISPHTIAVAYVGKNWKEYCSEFKELIFSPTQGTCKKAILEIVKKNLIENIYPLDNLHSKIYLGQEHAFVGSSNLSDNAHSESGLLETGVLISALNDKDTFKSLQPIIDKYKEISRINYPTEKSILDAIEAIPERSMKPKKQNSSPDFLKYTIDDPSFDIIIAWYLPKSEVGKYKFKDIKEDDIEGDCWNNFDETYKFKKGDRVLCWQCDQENLTSQNSDNFYWFTVTDIKNDGIAGQDPYTTVVYQRKGFKNCSEPFKLTKRVRQCFDTVMRSGKYDDFYKDNSKNIPVGQDNFWSIPSSERTKEFLKAWQNEVQKSEELSK